MSSNTNQTTARRSVAEIVAHNSDPKNGISLCIPRVFNNIGWKRVKRHMIEANLGFVEAVHLIPRGQFKRAYVHFRANSWNMRDPVARQALTALQNGQKIRIEYDAPWYWEVSISRSERRAEAPKPKERKVQIRLASPPAAREPPVNEFARQRYPWGLPGEQPNLNDPIVARAMATGSSTPPLSYDMSRQCDDEMRVQNPAAAVAAGLVEDGGEAGEGFEFPNATMPAPELTRQSNDED